MYPPIKQHPNSSHSGKKSLRQLYSQEWVDLHKYMIRPQIASHTPLLKQWFLKAVKSIRQNAYLLPSLLRLKKYIVYRFICQVYEIGNVLGFFILQISCQFCSSKLRMCPGFCSDYFFAPPFPSSHPSLRGSGGQGRRVAVGGRPVCPFPLVCAGRCPRGASSARPMVRGVGGCLHGAICCEKGRMLRGGHHQWSRGV